MANLLAGLLSEGQWSQFENAIRSVTDTFGQLPVTYESYGDVDTRWGEDRAGGTATYELVSLGEYGATAADENKESVVGILEAGGIAVSFNLEYLREQGLINPDHSVKFNSATDYFTVYGTRYKVDRIAYDGQLRDKYALVVVSGKADKQ